MKHKLPIMRCILMLSPVAFGEVTVDPPLPITHRVTVNPIITRSGNQVAEGLGTTAQRTYIQEQINRIWAQSGIEIVWLPFQDWNNSFAYDGNGADYSQTRRPQSHLDTITSNSSAPTMSNADAINMFFVEACPGFSDLGEFSAAGLAFVDSGGTTVYVGSNLLGFENGRDVIASVLAHEIGHNLALFHATQNGENDRLMYSGPLQGTADRVIQSETNQVFTDTPGFIDGFDLLELIPTQSNYEQWAETNNLQQNEFGDDDGDGIKNLMEFALGMNPTQSDNTLFPAPSYTSGNSFTWNITKEAGAVADGISYTVQVSDNLNQFLAAGTANTGSTVIQDTPSTLSVSVSGSTRRFARLRVTPAPAATLQNLTPAENEQLEPAIRQISNCGVDGCGFHTLSPPEE